MSFFVVQTRKSKKSKPILTVVPAKWVKNKVVYWPHNNFITLSKNKDSMSDENAWKQEKCKVVAKAATYDKAEYAMQKLEGVTDSEDAIEMTTGTRLNPPKKKAKFVSKTYQLKTSLPEQPTPQSTSQLIVEDTVTITSAMIKYAVDQQQAIPDDTAINYEHQNAEEPAAHNPVALTGTHIILDGRVCSTGRFIPAAPLPVNDGVQNSEQPAEHNPDALNGAPMIVDGQVCSTGSFTPAASCEQNEQSTPMWNIPNIFTDNSGRQYLRTVDGSFVEITLQPANDQLMAVNALETQQPNASRIVSAEIHPISTERFQTINVVGSQLGSQTINEMEFLPINPTGMQFANETEKVTHVEEEQLIDSENQPMKVDNVQGGYCSGCSQQFGEIISRLDRIEPALQKVVFFMADFQRYMRMKSTDQTEVESKKMKFQDFSEYEGFFPIYTEDQLLTLESSLKNAAANDKLFDYFESVYNLNGKRDNGPFFKTLMRKILVPTTVHGFSWKGQSRCKKDSMKTENKSFKDTFPSFVKFVHRVVRAADFEFTQEANDDAFSIYLRNKNTEIQRHEKGSSEQREAHVRRKRTPKNVTATKTPTTEDPDQDSEPTDSDAKSYDSIDASSSSH